MNKRLTITLLFFVSMFVLSGAECRSTVGQGQAAPSPGLVLPEAEKIRSVGFGYSQGGRFGKTWFFGDDGKSHHWIETWRF